MTKRSCWTYAVVLTVCYIAGLVLFIIGITNTEEKLTFLLIGLGICGLPTGIVAVIVAKELGFGRASLDKRLLAFLIGLVLGLVTTPVMILYFVIYGARIGAKNKKQESVPPPAPPQEEENKNDIEL